MREIFDLRDWARVISAHAWWISMVVVVVMLGTALVTFTATPYYLATQRILIERESDQVLKVPEIYETDSANSDFYLTQYKILESAAVARAALELLPAADRAWFERKGDAVTNFMRLRRIVPIRKSRLVDLRTEHPEPKVAEFMAEALINAYVQQAQARRDQASKTATQRLREDARSLKAKMLEARRVAQDYRSQHGILDVHDRQSLAGFRLQTLNTELALVERDLSTSEVQLRSATKAIHSGDFTSDLPEVLNNDVISEFKIAYLDFSTKLSQLQGKYKEKHPRIAEMRSKVEATANQLNREVRAVYGGLQHENTRLRQRQQSILARIEAQTKKMRDQDAHFVRYGILKDEAKSTQETYEKVLARLQEVEVIEDYGVSNVHPIGTARVSSVPVRPRPVFALGIALLAALILALTTAFVLDAMDNTIKSSHEAERLLELPVLGMVPRVRGGGSTAAVDERAMDPGSSVAESFRSIRTQILLSEPGKRLHSLVVTSTSAGEGKSLVAMNLAASFARAGHRVLLVDAEMRRPRLHTAMKIQSVDGFSSVLAGERRIEEVAFETPEDNLYFTPCGVIPSNPLELLTIGLTTRVRHEIGEYFDLVVFDAPPVGLVSDACVLASGEDQVLFVVRTFTAHRVRARGAIRALQSTGARIAGLIVNHADSKSERGRQLDVSYEPAYASMPTPRVPDRPTVDDLPSIHVADIDEAEVDHEIEQLGVELSHAMRDLEATDTDPRPEA